MNEIIRRILFSAILLLVLIVSVFSQVIRKEDQIFLAEVDKKIADKGFETKISILENELSVSRSQNNNEAIVKALDELIGLKINYIAFVTQFRKVIFFPKSKPYLMQITFGNDIENHRKEIMSIFEGGKIPPSRLIAKTYFEFGNYILVRNHYSYFNPKKSKKGALIGEQMIESSIPIYEKALGLNDLETLTIIDHLANHYYIRGKYEHAMRHYKILVSRMTSMQSPKQIDFNRILVNYANVIRLLPEEEEFKITLEKISQIAQTKPTKNAVIDLGLRTFDDRYFAASGYPEPAIVARIPNNTSLAGQPSNTQGQFEILSRFPGSKPRGYETEFKVQIEIDEKGNALAPIVLDCSNEKVYKTIVKMVYKMKFEPFVFEGKSFKIKGILIFHYFSEKDISDIR